MRIMIRFCLITASLLTTGVLSSSAENADTIRLTPMAQASAEQLRLPGRKPSPYEIDWSILVEWEKSQVGSFNFPFPNSLQV